MFQKTNYHSTVQSGLFNALGLMGVQMLVVIFVALMWGLDSFNAMLFAFLGGLVFILPNSYFAYRFFAKGRKTNQPHSIVGAFYKGEMIKLLMTAGLALAIFATMKVRILPFIVGFAAATLGLWMAPLLLTLRQDPRAAQR